MKSLGSVTDSLPISQAGNVVRAGSARSTTGSLATRQGGTIQRATARETDQAVRALLPASVSSSLRWQTQSLIAADGQFEGEETSGARIVGSPPPADLEAALRLLDQACAPAPRREITAALAELALLAKARAEDGMDTTMRIAALVPLLSEFPGDVALTAIRRHRDGYKFFPSWAELRMTCQIIGSRRMAMRKALRDRQQAAA